MLKRTEHEDRCDLAAMRHGEALPSRHIREKDLLIRVFSLPLIHVEALQAAPRILDDAHDIRHIVQRCRAVIKLFGELDSARVLLYRFEKFSVGIIRGRELFKHVRPLVHGALKLLLAPPELHLRMVAVYQHLRHRAPFPHLRPCVLRVFEQPVPMALAGVALLIGKHPRH